MGLNKPQNNIIGCVWGFAEAVFFFFVPDIWLSRLALKDMRSAMICLFYTTVGAIAGGLVMYAAGNAWLIPTVGFLDAIPAISPGMIEESGKAISEHGFLPALLTGMAGGMPYKMYAVWAGHLNIAPLAFVAASAAARMTRFIIVTIIYFTIARLLAMKFSEASIFRVYVASWVAFYAFYFWTFGLF